MTKNNKTKFKPDSAKASTGMRQTEIGSVPEEWKVVRFGDYVELRHGHQFRQHDFVEKGLRIFKITQISNDGTINLSNCSFISEDRLPEFEDQVLNEGDILMALTGATIGKFARFKDDGSYVLQNYRVGNFLPIDSTLSKDYLYYFLSSADFSSQIHAKSTQSAQQNIGKEEINNMLLTLPPLPEQRRIASILSSLDDKIELNRRMNENLEEIGRTLFRRWFVEFEFPYVPLNKGESERSEYENNPSASDSVLGTHASAGQASLVKGGMGYKSSGGKMVDSELGEIPEGWRVIPLDKLADFLNGLALQKFPPTGENDLPVIKIRELQSGITQNTDRANNTVGEEYVIENGDVLFSWSGSLMLTVWTGGKGALNQHLFKVTSKEFPKWLYYFWTLEFLAKFQQIAASKATTMGHIKRGDLSSSLCVIPDDGTIKKMNKIMKPIFDKTIQDSIEIQSLSQLRDSLLPRLMSGRVRA